MKKEFSFRSAVTFVGRPGITFLNARAARR